MAEIVLLPDVFSENATDDESERDSDTAAADASVTVIAAESDATIFLTKLLVSVIEIVDDSVAVTLTN